MRTLKKLTQRIGFGTLAMLATASALAADPGVTNDKIVLGVVIPLSGPPSIIGKAIASTLKVWEQDVNARGGIAGRKIDIRIEDDGYVPQRSVQSLKKLVDVDQIFALIGVSGSSQLLAMLPIIDEQKIPAINHIAINSAHFNPPRKTLFNIGATYCQEVSASMKHLVTTQKLQGSKFALIFQEDDYGTDVKCGYDQALKELGLKSAIEVPYKRGAKDFSAEVLSVQRAGATFVLTGGIITETAAMLKEIAKNQMKVVRLAPHPSHLPAVLALSGPAADGLYIAEYVPPVTDTETQGIGKLTALTYKYLSADDVKSLNRYSLTAYVGAQLMESALTACGKNLTRACLVEKLEQTKNFNSDGIMAPLTFGPNIRQSGTRPILLKANTATGKFERASGFLGVK
ncbi:MAG: ABC transporter substrate-binding protein [Burkholderiales bacterium]|uniref:ABC transporter substrate-binding protein n=1 Tax=Polaromonas sp. TaxID=1869339 RepID=UPI00352A6D8B|nr:ABC transporter substrate-binding protein [Burkholderiales bacterium]